MPKQLKSKLTVKQLERLERLEEQSRQADCALSYLQDAQDYLERAIEYISIARREDWKVGARFGPPNGPSLLVRAGNVLISLKQAIRDQEKRANDLDEQVQGQEQ